MVTVNVNNNNVPTNLNARTPDVQKISADLLTKNTYVLKSTQKDEIHHGELQPTMPSNVTTTTTTND